MAFVRKFSEAVLVIKTLLTAVSSVSSLLSCGRSLHGGLCQAQPAGNQKRICQPVCQPYHQWSALGLHQQRCAHHEEQGPRSAWAVGRMCAGERRNGNEQQQGCKSFAFKRNSAFKKNCSLAFFLIPLFYPFAQVMVGTLFSHRWVQLKKWNTGFVVN